MAPCHGEQLEPRWLYLEPLGDECKVAERKNTMGHASTLTRELYAYAAHKEIDLVGVTTTRPFRLGPDSRGALTEKFGYAAIDPAAIFPGARSVVVGILGVHDGFVFKPSQPGIPRGKYYQSPRVGEAGSYLNGCIIDFFKQRGYRVWLWHGLLPRKMAAVRAGIAQYGKNGTVFANGLGNMIVLVCIVTDAALEAVEYPVRSSDCGECSECVKACPTGAVYKDYCIDRDRCICLYNYNYREHPKSFRGFFQNFLLGCPVCHESCPKNESVKPKRDFPFKLNDIHKTPELIPLLEGDMDHYRQAVRAVWLRSPGKVILQRNAAIGLGNIGDPAGVGALCTALSHKDSRVRGASAWSLGRIGGKRAQIALEKAQKAEENESVLYDIAEALGSIT
jgi:epoxyqueuosine reductase